MTPLGQSEKGARDEDEAEFLAYLRCATSP